MINIPLFPLKLVLLPYEKLPLHIFEPRYKKMISNSLDHGDPFGIVLRNQNEIHSIGCSVEITKVFKKYPNGEYDLMVQGKDLFNILKTDRKMDTIFGEIDYIESPMPIKDKELIKLQESYLKVLIRFGKEINIERHLDFNISYQFIKKIQLPLRLKKKILEIPSENERVAFIQNIFNNILSDSSENNNTINNFIPEA